MVTSTDICNRALQMVGTRATITSLIESSTEAQNCNLIYATIVDWCFSVANWNFARKVAPLSQTKVAPAAPLPSWSATYPAPPWTRQYTFPTDAVRIQYVLSQASNVQTISGTLTTTWVGTPVKFAVGMDVIATVPTRVILCHETLALVVYTINVTDPTLWPSFFERAVVAMLAWHLARDLTGNAELVKFLEDIAEKYMSVAVTINQKEGLVVEDTTPEWIQARGIMIGLRRPPPNSTRAPTTASEEEQPRANRR